MKVKLVLTSRLEKTWVHYDHTLIDVKTGEVCGFMRSTSQWGYGDPPAPSFKASMALNYILSPDKKKWRKDYKNWDGEVKIDQFGEKQFIRSFDCFGRTNGVNDVNITEVVVENPVYIDPCTGIVWIPRELERNVYSKRLWLFKKMPQKPGSCWIIDPHYLVSTKSKTAFASGTQILSRTQDHRAFLYEKPKKDKQCIIKSVTRQLKKLIKTVKPISEQTKNFFKLAGAFKHLKTQQKYAN